MADRKQKFNIEVGSGIIAIFPKMEINTIQSFAEFIDNSIQSFVDHEEILKRECNSSDCYITITWTNDEIVITDNAFGMNEEDFGRALRLNAPRSSYSPGSLSKYGMGLKYAAASLGKWYSIETTAYNSDVKYYGVIDIDDLTTNNPKELECIVSDAEKDEHYTKIVIKKLIRKFSIAEQDKLINLIGIVYENFLDEKIVTIIFNNNKITYSEPEYRRDKNNVEYTKQFHNSFFLDGKTYEYIGFIAILKKGNYDATGFQLKQNKRVIELNYKPNEIFGKGGTYKRLRIFGEIEFIGDSWIPRFDKDGLAREGTGVEEALIESLKKDEKVKSMLSICSNLNKIDNPTCKVTTTCNNSTIKGVKNTYKIGEVVSFAVKPNPGFKIKEVRVGRETLNEDPEHKGGYAFTAEEDTAKIVISTIRDLSYVEPVNIEIDDNLPGNKDTKNDVSTANTGNDYMQPISALSPKQKVENRFAHLKDVELPNANLSEGVIDESGYIICFKNTKLSFDIRFNSEDNSQDFLEIKEKPGFVNSFIIVINLLVKSYKGFNPFGIEREILIVNALSIAIARYFAIHNGLTALQTQMFINAINKINN